MKWSVIIPTLWKSDRIHQLLTDLNSCDEVGEIILIDNAFGEPITLDKVKHYRLRENIFVNPAWNLGVTLANNEHIALINDDVNFDTNVFSWLLTQDYGTCGMAWENYNIKDKRNYQLFELKERPYGWGCAIFTSKSDYNMINETLKIACGDEWLIKFSKKPMILRGLKIESEISTTSNLQEYGHQQYLDNQLWHIMNNKTSAEG